VAAFGAGATGSLPGRNASPGFRFTLCALICVGLMVLDQRGGWLDQVRYVLQAIAYPLQLVVNSPTTAWQILQDNFESRDALQRANAILRNENRRLALRSFRQDALELENAQLRGLQRAIPPLIDQWIAAEVISIELNSLRQRVLINRGTQNGVFGGQAVLDEQGLVGQTTRVGPWSAEIILVTDPEHAVPVQIERNGLRTIAVGAGDALALPYLPANADVKQGDVLITSGLGGVFPEGYPVAKVVKVQRDAIQPLAQVLAQPLAQLDRDREVMLVWFKDAHPAAPAPASGDLKTGTPGLQAQPARGGPAVPDVTKLGVPKAGADASTLLNPQATRPAAGGSEDNAPPPKNKTPEIE